MANTKSGNRTIKIVKSMILEGYEAHVFCDGVQLPEFVVSEIEGTRMICYIPSEAGKTFSVRIADPGRRSKRKKLYAKLFAHTQYLTGGYLDRGGSIELDRVKSGNSYRKLLFDAVKTVEEKPQSMSASYDIDSVNTIEVKIWSVRPKWVLPSPTSKKDKHSPKKSGRAPRRVVRDAKHGWGTQPTEAVDFLGQVDETCKRQGLNTVGLGPEIISDVSHAKPASSVVDLPSRDENEEDEDEDDLAVDFDADHGSDDDYEPPTPAKAQRQYSLVESNRKPRAHFIFRHHPKEYLQAMTWMPLTRPSTPQSDESAPASAPIDTDMPATLSDKDMPSATGMSGFSTASVGKSQTPATAHEAGTVDLTTSPALEGPLSLLRTLEMKREIYTFISSFKFPAQVEVLPEGDVAPLPANAALHRYEAGLNAYRGQVKAAATHDNVGQSSWPAIYEQIDMAQRSYAAELQIALENHHRQTVAPALEATPLTATDPSPSIPVASSSSAAYFSPAPPVSVDRVPFPSDMPSSAPLPMSTPPVIESEAGPSTQSHVQKGKRKLSSGPADDNSNASASPTFSMDAEEVKPDVKPNTADLEVLADIDALEQLEEDEIRMELRLNKLEQARKRRRIAASLSSRRTQVKREGPLEMVDLTLDD